MISTCRDARDNDSTRTLVFSSTDSATLAHIRLKESNHSTASLHPEVEDFSVGSRSAPEAPDVYRRRQWMRRLSSRCFVPTPAGLQLTWGVRASRGAASGRPSCGTWVVFLWPGWWETSPEVPRCSRIPPGWPCCSWSPADTTCSRRTAKKKTSSYRRPSAGAGLFRAFWPLTFLSGFSFFSVLLMVLFRMADWAAEKGKQTVQSWPLDLKTGMKCF